MNNQKVKEIADKVKWQCQDVTYRELEKFTELIIQECADIVNSLEEYKGRGDCSTAEYIKEHFGFK